MAYDAAEITRRLRASQAKKAKEKKEKEARASNSRRRGGPDRSRSVSPGTKPPARSGGVVRKGQRATLNGKPVVADGKGNWVQVKRTDGVREIGSTLRNPKRTVAGTYKPGVVRKPTSAKPKPKPSSIPGKPGYEYPAPGPKQYRQYQEDRRRAGLSYNPNDTRRKPSTEPLDKPVKPVKPVKPTTTKPAATKPAATKTAAKPSRPNPRMTGEGAPRPNAGNKSSTAKKVSRLAKALSDKKGMKSYMDRLRKKK